MTRTKDQLKEVIQQKLEGQYNQLDLEGVLPGVLKDTLDLIPEVTPQVQSDWNEADAESPAFIKNKPEIPSGGGGAQWFIFPHETYDSLRYGLITQEDTGFLYIPDDVVGLHIEPLEEGDSHEYLFRIPVITHDMMELIKTNLGFTPGSSIEVGGENYQFDYYDAMSFRAFGICIDQPNLGYGYAKFVLTGQFAASGNGEHYFEFIALVEWYT